MHFRLRWQTHSQETTNDRQVANAVNGEAHAFPHACDDHTGKGWPDNARAVDQGRIEGNGASEIIRPDNFLQKGLSRWHLKGLQDAGHERESKNFPDIDPAIHRQYS